MLLDPFFKKFIGNLFIEFRDLVVFMAFAEIRISQAEGTSTLNFFPCLLSFALRLLFLHYQSNTAILFGFFFLQSFL